jgi:hypothetical protein
MTRMATQPRIRSARSVAASLILLGVTVTICGSLMALRRSACSDISTCDSIAAMVDFFIVLIGSLGVFLAAYVMYPPSQEFCRHLRARWRATYTVVALAAASAGFSLFIVYFGNRAFGGLDLSALIDAGWRPASGQEPYRDYICTFPPGFYLGVKYAFLAFGAKWDSQLYADAILACVSFVWIYHLLGDLLESRLPSFLIAATIECCTLLPLSFWWYNPLTSITATTFFLSCLVYVSFPGRLWPQLSYLVSLSALCLMKPNIAAPLAILAILLVLVITPSKARFALLTLTAVACALAALSLSGVDVRGMIAGYRSAAKDRGVFSMLGFRRDSFANVLRADICVAILSIPLWLLRRRLTNAFRAGDIRAIAWHLLLGLGPAIAVFGMFSNVDYKDLEWPMLICSGSVALFGKSVRLQWGRRVPALARAYVAFLCSLAAADLYVGAIRSRVEGMGLHSFFEWNDSSHASGMQFFPNLRTSAGFQTAVGQVREVLGQHPGPIFFGPRMEFNYAAFGLPSPKHLPIIWDPGNQFPFSEEGSMLASWQRNRFATLIFQRDDFIFYSPQFLQLIDSLYSRDDSYSMLTVFHAKPGVIGTGSLRTSDGVATK